MDFALSNDHVFLQDSAAKFVNEQVDLSPLLRPGADVSHAGYDRLWSQISELGWSAITVPEAYGGLGMSYIDLIMIIGETGRTLAPSPLFGTLAGAWAMQAAGSDRQKSEWLPKLSDGLKLALAMANENGSYDSTAPDVVAEPAKEGFKLKGAKSFVVDAASADAIVVSAMLDGRKDFFIVNSGAPGLDVEILEWRDITRQVCKITLSDVNAERLEESNDQVWPWVRDRLYLVLAAESAAGIKAVLDDAVDYAKERIAFGRPIGAFQAIKHQLANIAGVSEAAAALVQYAAWALSENDQRASLAAAMAQSYASEQYKQATHRNIQIFGAIGFTWEMKNHLYYKRARCNAELLGSPASQREQVVRILEHEAA
ncbi:acyl-CoA dehydrogenase family protein [Henriciella aquimarina]|uniref:acyl-CoA dehydrogenase family protein n=1 Tax=Henriciella aquimarina TaxID=545261 RepID=UPI0009FCFB22|nr:acyl-CoA dehydrogenase family protein [Henriciella aquimarina]